ncbi:hypothetical protein WA026_008745 [Henosepilachna vigintioctopunctata]|uniref:Uncharacterized protein n=1 Tax=Henosepilachna vigintioctopunctata TaxID=420089 RepID=A0AAW1VCC2_9CUCU
MGHLQRMPGKCPQFYYVDCLPRKTCLGFYPKLPPESHAQLNQKVIVTIKQKYSDQLRQKVCEVTFEVARNIIVDDGVPRLVAT